jgi:hypothetical protein
MTFCNLASSAVSSSPNSQFPETQPKSRQYLLARGSHFGSECLVGFLPGAGSATSVDIFKVRPLKIFQFPGRILTWKKTASGSVPSFRTCAYNGRLRLTKVAVLVHSVDMTTTTWAIEQLLMGRRT